MVLVGTTQVWPVETFIVLFGHSSFIADSLLDASRTPSLRHTITYLPGSLPSLSLVTTTQTRNQRRFCISTAASLILLAFPLHLI